MNISMNEVVIVVAIRTPIGAYKGSLKELSADKLGSIVIREILRKNESVFKNNGFGWYMIIYTSSSFVEFDLLNKDVCSLFKK